MRLLSLFKDVETTIVLLQPECSFGWKRKVNYSDGNATLWNDGLKCILNLHVCEVQKDSFSVKSEWTNFEGKVFYSKTHFCSKSFDWQRVAETLAENMPLENN